MKYASMWPSHMDTKAHWFRHHFIGKPYFTYIGPLSSKQDGSSSRGTRPSSGTKSGVSSTGAIPTAGQGDENETIITIVQERAKDFGGPGNAAASVLGSQYRIIIRSKNQPTGRCIIHESMARDTVTHLHTIKQHQRLNCSRSDQRRSRSLRNSMSGGSPSSFLNRLMRAAILYQCPGLDMRQFKELSAETVIMSGLEKELLRFDEIGVPKNYKFGVLTVNEGQTTEEAWFSNRGLSENLDNFLSIIAHQVTLKGYSGYAAGLDTKTGESGDISYATRWRDNEVMFHVAPLMPSREHDKQQIHRKRHLGNDIVCIVFIEGNQSFDPKAIRSQFLHVYIVIHPENIQGKRAWRVEVVRNKNVPEFGPAIPSPGLIYDEEELREFLILKRKSQSTSIFFATDPRLFICCCHSD
ncbi:uncharacterized protein BYT42DRAFT_44626 [Radiomyces spectabilis]|uniref:uncharacterized protein n=1 Tax=Radiomyces spectabilis TaxID=64574 RepID=UPI00221E6ADC|nr:uncharacterized protein BYT42DRAFT_44626 [Radiomyces spectabilis]KAI8372754.1 hypothetical protein BYT42DRAFT_44626 [Radiomyces spectabilis]